WSSDVCSSDLSVGRLVPLRGGRISIEARGRVSTTTRLSVSDCVGIAISIPESLLGSELVLQEWGKCSCLAIGAGGRAGLVWNQWWSLITSVTSAALHSVWRDNFLP